MGNDTDDSLQFFDFREALVDGEAPIEFESFAQTERFHRKQKLRKGFFQTRYQLEVRVDEFSERKDEAVISLEREFEFQARLEQRFWVEIQFINFEEIKVDLEFDKIDGDSVVENHQNVVHEPLKLGFE